MQSICIALAVLIPFLGITFIVCRGIQSLVAQRKAKPILAALILWLEVLCLPWLLVWLWVPVANYIFITYPSLHSPAWDVGLAVSLYIGMCMSYLFGVLAACIVTWQLIFRSTQRRTESAT